MSSESPKWIALVLSIFAITISSLSWWESHQARLINQEINRPLLQLDEVKLERSKSFSELTFYLSNIGKSTARVTKVEYLSVARIWNETGPNCFFYGGPFRGQDFGRPDDDLLAGGRDQFHLQVKEKECEPHEYVLGAFIVDYINPTTSAAYRQRFEQRLELSLPVGTTPPTPTPATR
jgi:hypothetical protein